MTTDEPVGSQIFHSSYSLCLPLTSKSGCRAPSKTRTTWLLPEKLVKKFVYSISQSVSGTTLRFSERKFGSERRIIFFRDKYHAPSKEIDIVGKGNKFSCQKGAISGPGEGDICPKKNWRKKEKRPSKCQISKIRKKISVTKSSVYHEPESNCKTKKKCFNRANRTVARSVAVPGLEPLRFRMETLLASVFIDAFWAMEVLLSSSVKTIFFFSFAAERRFEPVLHQD